MNTYHFVTNNRTVTIKARSYLEAVAKFQERFGYHSEPIEVTT